MKAPAGRVVSINISAGGIPKLPVESTSVEVQGLSGDGHHHAKHNTPLQAVSLLDLEDIHDLQEEGFDVGPGSTGENLTLAGLDVDRFSPGDTLTFEGGVALELTKKRKPCYVLDQISPQLKAVIGGRCGFLAKVLLPGRIHRGESVHVLQRASAAHVQRCSMAGAVLAGGESSRMGMPKHSVKLASGEAMIDRLIALMGEMFEQIVLVGSARTVGDLLRIQDQALNEITVIADVRESCGPVSGVEALLSSDIAAEYLVCPCDMPGVSATMLRELVNVAAGATDALATVTQIRGGELQPLPLRISAEALPQVRGFLDEGQRSLRGLLNHLKPHVVSLPERFSECYVNVNTPEDVLNFRCVSPRWRCRSPIEIRQS